MTNRMGKEGGHPAPSLNLRGARQYVSAIEAPAMANRRLIVLLFAAIAAVVALALAILLMLPLKERIPYTVEVEVDASGKPTGRVAVSEATMARFQPQEAHIRYFLARWVEDLMTVDETSRTHRLPRSYALCRGDALTDWQRYVSEQGRPLKILSETPGYRQTAQLISIQFLSESTALIRVKLTNNRNAEKRVQITVSFALLPPRTDEEVYRNPIGLWITKFGVADELA